MKVSLCLLVWNELEGCQHDVPLLPKDEFYELFAVDGGSSDGTVEYLKSQGVTVYKQPVKSLNAAYWHAVQKCNGDSLVIYFPKGTIGPSCTRLISQQLKKNTELVIASRNVKHGKNEEDNQWVRPRKWGVLLLAVLSALVWRREGPWIRDVLHGVKGFSIAAYKKMNIAQTGVSIDIEMVIRSYRLKQSRVEIPVIENSRIAGQTHFKLLPTARRLAFFLWKEITTRPV